MADLANSILLGLVQVTLALVPAGAIVLLLGRRHAASAMTVALVAMLSAAALTMAAFAPVPDRWTWATATSPVEPDAAAESSLDMARQGRVQFDILNLLMTIRPVAAARPDRSWNWRDLVAIAAIGCGTLSVLRWLLGHWALVKLRRNSRPVSDAALIETAAELQERFGICRRIEVRETAEIGTAATFGICRPVILLAENRTAWTPADLRAVLSHELAHIRRRDFAWTVVTRVCLAINACHPLVHWLAGRLRLAQEIAADRLAAPLAGGVAEYRRSLARLALNQNRAPIPSLAQSFGSTRNSLMGRIDMLTFIEGRGRSLGRSARLALIGVVAAIGFAASAVRGPAQTPASAVQPAVAEYPPFELGYLGDDCQAFAAIRPAALFTRPDMKPVLDTLSAAIGSLCTAVGLPADVIRLDQIEQIIGPVELKSFTEEQRKKMPGGERHSISMGLVLIRMSGDFDWSGVLRSLPKAFPVTEKGDGLFEVRSPLFGPHPMTLRVLDKRTLVTTAATDAQAAARRAEIAAWATPAILAEANRAGLTLVVNNSKARWTATISENPRAEPIVAALGNPDRLAFCLNWGERVTASLFSDRPVGDGIAGELEKQLRTAEPGDATDRRLLELVAEMLRSMKVRRDGALSRADMSSSFRWADVLSVALHRGSANVEVREEKK